MTYTLWSHGELLGESALDYVRVLPAVRTGDLDVTERGLIVMERLSQTREDCYRSALRVNKENPEDVDESDLAALHADLDAQRDQHDALALELRGSDGSVIPTDGIYISDTFYLRRIDDEREAEGPFITIVTANDDPGADDMTRVEEEQFEEIEEQRAPWLSEPPERELVRFQIAVMLRDEWAIP
jgi:hypothetical protein